MRQSLLLGWGDWREHGTVLFRLLVQQALEDLPITTRLALNCCNTLSWVPYCALNYKRRFLIEDYEIVFSSFTPNPIDKVITTGRAAALPSKNLTSVQTLPGVVREIDIVSTYRHHRRQTTVETNNLSELLKSRPSVLHLAGHFEIPVDSGPPRLDLGPAGSLSLKQLLSMEWDCDLVYLSACNTGVRAIADKALKAPVKYSLADCVIERGAHSAIGTLWDIPDNNTTDFVAQFYRTLQSCSDPVTALAVTQRDMIATTDGNRGDWAAYRQFQ